MGKGRNLPRKISKRNELHAHRSLEFHHSSSGELHHAPSANVGTANVTDGAVPAAVSAAAKPDPPTAHSGASSASGSTDSVKRGRSTKRRAKPPTTATSDTPAAPAVPGERATARPTIRRASANRSRSRSVSASSRMVPLSFRVKEDMDDLEGDLWQSTNSLVPDPAASEAWIPAEAGGGDGEAGDGAAAAAGIPGSWVCSTENLAADTASAVGPNPVPVSRQTSFHGSSAMVTPKRGTSFTVVESASSTVTPTPQRARSVSPARRGVVEKQQQREAGIKRLLGDSLAPSTAPTSALTSAATSSSSLSVQPPGAETTAVSPAGIEAQSLGSVFFSASSTPPLNDSVSSATPLGPMLAASGGLAAHVSAAIGAAVTPAAAAVASPASTSRDEFVMVDSHPVSPPEMVEREPATAPAVSHDKMAETEVTPAAPAPAAALTSSGTAPVAAVEQAVPVAPVPQAPAEPTALETGSPITKFSPAEPVARPAAAEAAASAPAPAPSAAPAPVSALVTTAPVSNVKAVPAPSLARQPSETAILAPLPVIEPRRGRDSQALILHPKRRGRSVPPTGMGLSGELLRRTLMIPTTPVPRWRQASLGAKV
ncbi:hypothetical protein H9P43_002442 [Blastocladiella emersonii ATCC 22665]|nr:hypothetical protein H9P43_002442 [Blastocladiella emersonii ATCC 22665]